MANYLIKCIKYKIGEEPEDEFIEGGWNPFAVTVVQNEWFVWLKKEDSWF